MRTLSGTLDTAQNSLHRSPIARMTVRNMRLSFASYKSITNPWGYADNALVDGQRYCFGDAIVTAAGTILRAWKDGSQLQVSRITDPTNTTQWQTWSVVVTTDGGNSNPGLYQTAGGTIYLFYVRVTFMAYRTSVDDGATWSGETSCGGSLSTLYGATVAPVSEDEVYVSGLHVEGDIIPYLSVLRFVNSGGWTNSTMPWMVHGDSTYSMTPPGYSTTTFFDAFSLGGKTFVVYCFGGRGKTWITQVSTGTAGTYKGLWGNPRAIIPDDYSFFVPYRVSVIQGRAWLTGMLLRQNQNAWSPQMDVYLSSIDGENWTAMSRDSYITSSEIRGKMLLTGSYVYYPGMATVYRAPATYLIDPAGDPSGQKMVIGAGQTFGGASTDDLLGFSLGVSAMDAPQLGLSLRNGDDGYFGTPKTNVMKRDSEIWAEAGYLTTAQPTNGEYAALARCSVDGIERGAADGQRSADVNARDALFKQLKSWQSMFYWPLMSQANHYDDCDKMDAMYIMNGAWSAPGDGFDFSDHDNVGILFSTTPFDCIDFDISARFYGQRYGGGIFSPRSYYGLIGLATDKDNYVAFRAHVNTYEVELIKVRAGALTVLASATIGTLLDAPHSMRLIHRDGHWLGYITSNTGTYSPDWFDPAIDYVWDQTDLPCPSENGRGKVGVYALINPYRFHAWGLSEESDVVCLRTSDDLDWGVLPSSGTVLWEGEEIAYANKTGSGTVTGGAGGDPEGVGACSPMALEGSRARVLADTYGFDDYTLLDGAGTPDMFNDFGVIFPMSGKPYSAWRIRDTVVDPLDGAKKDLRTYKWVPDGYPYMYAYGGFDQPTVVMAPCLYNVTRGANGTTAIVHTDNSLCYTKATHVIGVFKFKFHDFETDYNTETLLKRVCGMAGVLSTEFASEVNLAGPFVKTGGANAYASPQWLVRDLDGLKFNSHDFDISFTASMPSSGSRVVLCFRSADAADIGATGPCLLELTDNGVLYYYHGAGGEYPTGVRIERWPVYETLPPAGQTLDWRVVVHSRAGGPSGDPHFDDFVTIYFNGTRVAAFYWKASLGANDYIGISAYNGAITYTNIRIPELHEWRDAVRIDNDQSAAAAIFDIIGDRYVKYLSRSGTTIKFSTFDKRDFLGELADVVYQSSDTDQDSEIFTAIRVYCDQIIEMVDDTLARANGFLMHVLRMPKADAATAAAMAARLFRSMQETILGRSIRAAANLTLEPEDRFQLVFAASGTGLYVNTMLIADSINYGFDPADFTMQVRGRKFIS